MEYHETEYYVGCNLKIEPLCLKRSAKRTLYILNLVSSSKIQSLRFEKTGCDEKRLENVDSFVCEWGNFAVGNNIHHFFLFIRFICFLYSIFFLQIFALVSTF